MNSPVNRQFTLASRPSGKPSTDNWALKTNSIPEPDTEQVLVKTRYISLDPGMRGMMDSDDSYIDPVKIGEVMWAIGVGEVVASRSSKFAEGDCVTGISGVQDYFVANAEQLTQVDPSIAPLPMYLSALGTTGMIAYFGLLEVGQPRPGETVVVSAASGAVGSIVGQIAKIQGCRVIGIAGGKEKTDYLTEKLGFEAAIDYKHDNVSDTLKLLCPDGVDIYFDNVGGDILDTVLAQITKHARIVLCGAISQYNATQPANGPKNYLSLLVNSAKMQGVLFTDYAARFPEAAQELMQWIEEGKIKTKEHIEHGLENFPDVFNLLFSGSKLGKLILEV